MFCEFETRLVCIAVIEFYGISLFPERSRDLVNMGCNGAQLLLILKDRHDNHVDRRQRRRQYQAIVIRMRQDEGANQACAYPPGSTPDIIEFAVLAGKLDIERLREILTEEM